MRFDIPLHLSSLLLLFTSRAIAVAVPAPDRLHSPDDGPTKLSNTCPASGKREICKDPIFFPTIYRNVGWPFANCEDFLAQFSKEHVKDTGDVHYFDFERLARPDPKGIGAEMVAKIRELLQGVDVKEVVRMNKVLHDPYFGCRFNLSDLTLCFSTSEVDCDGAEDRAFQDVKAGLKHKEEAFREWGSGS